MIEGDRVIHEARYPHPPERVWRALTDRAELAAWLMPNDFSLREGARFRFDARPAHAEDPAVFVANHRIGARLPAVDAQKQLHGATL